MPTRNHLWTNHEVRLEKDQLLEKSQWGEMKFSELAFFLLLIIFKSDLVVGPDMVPGRHMQFPHTLDPSRKGMRDNQKVGNTATG